MGTYLKLHNEITPVQKGEPILTDTGCASKYYHRSFRDRTGQIKIFAIPTSVPSVQTFKR